jgi:L-alanine-DL-glutamate epimerase-like enolase superfamily enzyme
MKVTKVEAVAHTRPPNPNPVRDALQVLPGAGSVEVRVETDDGVAGRGDIYFGRIAGGPAALVTLIEQVLTPVVAGTDPAAVRATHEAMLRETEYLGSFGLAMWGVAALDTALWDCLGKARGVPCWTLWGAVHDRIPAYAMVGWLNYPDDEVQRICARAVEQGYRGVKIKVGFPTLREDARRVELVRRAVGEETRLMVDANQSLTTAEAIRRGRAFQDLGCYWWEEPLPAHDVDGYAELAAALDIPIATGENLYTKHDFARFLRRDAVDIVQPDLRRGGGPTALLQIGLMADAFGRPYASHGGEAAHMNVMACLPNTHYVELGLLSPDSPMKLTGGCVNIPQGPGFSWE